MKMVLPVDGYRSATDFMEAMQGTASDAYWLLKPGEFWHGGVHLYENFASNAVYRPESHGLKCMTDGHAVAWRLNDNYQTATYDNNLLKFSSTFVLIKSTCVPDEDKSANALEFYTLWMQIAPLSEYGTDTPTATVTASSLKVRQDNPAQGWGRTGLSVGNVPDASHCYEAPLDTHTTLPKDTVVEIEEEATFLLNGQPAPFMFVRVKSVPDGKVSGLSAGESGWISGLDTYVKRKASNLPGWMQKAREHGVFNQVVSGKSVEVKAGDLIGHLSYHERPETAPQHFCHLEVFSQDQRMEDFLANKAGVTKGAAQLHTLPNKTLWKYIADSETFVAAEVGGAPSLSTAERFTSESDCQNKISDGKTWYEIPAESAWMSADDVEKVNQFDLEKRGFIRLEQNEEPQSIFQTPREGWLRQTFGRLEELTRSESSDTYSSGDAEGYQKLLQEMDTNQDGLIDANELWRYLHNNQPHIQYQVQRLVVKHHSEWLKDGMTTLWQTALNEQAGSYPELALYNYEYINKLVWMKDVQEIRSSEALWHMHPVVFLDAMSIKSVCACNRDITFDEIKTIAPGVSDTVLISNLEQLNQGFRQFGINTCRGKTHFLAQVLHESGYFRFTSEIGGRNAFYQPWYGRGLIQVTLETNYIAYGNYIGEDVSSSATNRDKLTTLPHSVLSAFWFYKIYKSLDTPADDDDFNKITAIINGGFNGYNDRLSIFNKAVQALNSQHFNKLMVDESFSLESSAIFQSKIYSFGWGIWHDPTSTKSGIVKSKEEALKGYRRSRDLLIESPFPESQRHKKIYGVEYGYLLSYINNRIDTLERNQ